MNHEQESTPVHGVEYVKLTVYPTLKMKTDMIIDEQLITEALQATGLKTQQEVIELGLKTLIRLKNQARIKDFKGKLTWEGNLEEIRLNS